MNFICYNICMKRLTIILTLFIIFLNGNSAFSANFVTKDYKILTKDNFSMVATLQYPKIKEKNDFSTVVFLHSLGYDSEWWGTLPQEFLDKGYAVLRIDLRGHGKSVYNSKLCRTSWKNLTNKAYAKYPDDVTSVIQYIKNENKRTFFKNWAYIGADIGGSTAIIAANQSDLKPKTIVILSPIVNTKGLYIPVHLAELNNIDILTIIGNDDIQTKKANAYLKKFAQSTYAEYESSSPSSGMIILKHDEDLNEIITTWLEEYMKP